MSWRRGDRPELWELIYHGGSRKGEEAVIGVAVLVDPLDTVAVGFATGPEVFARTRPHADIHVARDRHLSQFSEHILFPAVFWKNLKDPKSRNKKILCLIPLKLRIY